MKYYYHCKLERCQENVAGAIHFDADSSSVFYHPNWLGRMPPLEYAIGFVATGIGTAKQHYQRSGIIPTNVDIFGRGFDQCILIRSPLEDATINAD